MVNCPVIDADGHVLEKERYIRKYLEAPWDKRSTALRTRDQPWDANLFDSFGRNNPKYPFLAGHTEAPSAVRGPNRSSRLIVR